MRVAFDVKGTLEGPKGQFLVEVLKAFREKGHEVTIWSNSFGYAHDCRKNLQLGNDVQMSTKSQKSCFDDSEDEQRYMDIAFEDDHTQDWLAAKTIIWVSDVPTELAPAQYVEGLIAKLGSREVRI